MDKQQATDEQLLILATAGDTAAFGDLYERYLDAIYQYVFYRVSSRQEAEDVTEGVFLRAWQALDSSPPREVPFRLWVYRIAHNAVIDHYRTRREQVGLDAAAQLPDPAAGPETAVVHQEQTNALGQAMQQLKEEHQAVLTARFIVGLSHAETAVAMARTEEAVRALQYRAVGALRQLLVMQDHRG